MNHNKCIDTNKNQKGLYGSFALRRILRLTRAARPVAKTSNVQVAMRPKMMSAFMVSKDTSRH